MCVCAHSCNGRRSLSVPCSSPATDGARLNLSLLHPFQLALPCSQGLYGRQHVDARALQEALGEELGQLGAESCGDRSYEATEHVVCDKARGWFLL